MKKPLDPVRQFRDWMKNTLRRQFFRYWERTKAIQAARVDRGVYKCAGCNTLSKIKGMHIDHIVPVVDPSVGFVDWDVYIRRLFCDASNLQLLCPVCHTAKTKKEQEARKAAKTGVFSDAHRLKMAEIKQGKPNLKDRRPITAIRIPDGFQEHYDSTKSASVQLDIPRKRITDVLIGRRNSANGWRFEYTVCQHDDPSWCTDKCPKRKKR